MKSKDSATLELIDKLLHNPLLLKKLSDRVYQLMQEEQWNQGDRDSNHCEFRE